MNHYSEKTPMARKPHTCEECGGKIQVGEKYIRYFCIFEGDVFHGARCSDCDPIFNKLNRLYWDGEIGVPLGCLVEEIFESGDPQLMADMIAIKEKRGGPIKEWQRARIATTSKAST